MEENKWDWNTIKRALCPALLKQQLRTQHGGQEAILFKKKGGSNSLKQRFCPPKMENMAYDYSKKEANNNSLKALKPWDDTTLDSQWRILKKTLYNILKTQNNNTGCNLGNILQWGEEDSELTGWIIWGSLNYVSGVRTSSWTQCIYQYTFTLL